MFHVHRFEEKSRERLDSGANSHGILYTFKARKPCTYKHTDSERNYRKKYVLTCDMNFGTSTERKTMLLGSGGFLYRRRRN